MKTYKKKNAVQEKQALIIESVLEAMENPAVRKQTRSSISGQMNRKSERRYNGGNAFYLAFIQIKRQYNSGQWLTFKQIKEAGGRLVDAKGQGVGIMYWNFKEVEEKQEDGSIVEKTIPIPRYYTVFNIDLVEGLEIKQGETYEHEDNKEAQEIVNNYFIDQDCVFMNSANGRAYYTPSTDTVSVPSKEHFETIGSYYTTVFHEMVHSTGHKTRLKRDLEGLKSFGDLEYSKEELVAEFGACMLGSMCCEVDIVNAGAYLAGWAKKIKKEGREKEVQTALSKATKAYKFVLGVE